MGGLIPFSDEQQIKIRAEYLTKPVKTLARELGVTPGRINRFLNRNNLQIPADIKENRKKESLFQKGDIPFTKGLKQLDYMSAEAIERTKKTRFKKGNIPHNTKENGAIVERTEGGGRVYKWIRISQGVWKHYHRFLWEKEFGSVPDGKVIAFIDGDTTNTVLSNLKLISKAENMIRNSIHEFPEEIIPSLVLVNELENKLKSIQNA